MTSTVDHPKYGKITYCESAFSGRKEIYIGGVKLIQISKTLFSYHTDAGDVSVQLSGNTFSGITLFFNGEYIQVTPKTAWYEYLFAISIFVIMLIWGNSVALCTIIPVVGGAIGGAAYGVCAIMCLLLTKKVQEIWKKILIWLGFLALAFVVGFLLALAVLSILY